jgi:hypothetical protein
VRLCSTSLRVTSGHGKILIITANVGIKSAWGTLLGLETSRTFCTHGCYLTGWLLNDIVTIRKLLFRSYLKMVLNMCGRGRGYSTTEIQRTIKMIFASGWTRHTQEGGLYTEGRFFWPPRSPDMWWIFSSAHTWKSTLMQSFARLSKISSEDFNQQRQRSLRSVQASSRNCYT